MRATLLLGLAVAVAACGGDPQPTLADAAPGADADPTLDAAPAREIVMATQSLQPGELVEGIWHGNSADATLMHLEAPTATLDWNIHSHATGNAVTVYEELGKMTVDYDFVPPADGDWYLLLRNGGTVTMDVKVVIRLYGAMTFVWQ
jgi:hypothetical protein